MCLLLRLGTMKAFTTSFLGLIFFIFSFAVSLRPKDETFRKQTCRRIVGSLVLGKHNNNNIRFIRVWCKTAQSQITWKYCSHETSRVEQL